MANAGKAEFRRRGAHMDDGAGGAQPFDHRIGMILDIVDEDERAMRRALALQPLRILDREANPFKWPRAFRSAGIDRFRRLRLVERFLEIAVGKTVDRRIDHFAAGDLRLDYIDGRDLAGPEQLQRVLSGQIAQIVIGHGQASVAQARAGRANVTQLRE